MLGAILAGVFLLYLVFMLITSWGGDSDGYYGDDD